MSIIADIRYPIGRFNRQPTITQDMRGAAIDVLRDLPAQLRVNAAELSDSQLDTPYRDGGWTVRQLVHHVADSHLNAYVRTKLALAEDSPTIKPYDQDAWAALADSRLPIAASLSILDGIHERWVALWRSLAPAQFGRTLNHPELGALTVDTLLQLYAWHSRHHVAHIAMLRLRRGW
jgi:hypothetical protein